MSLSLHNIYFTVIKSTAHDLIQKPFSNILFAWCFT